MHGGTADVMLFGEPYRIPVEHLCGMNAGSGVPVGHHAESLLEGKSRV